MANLTSVIKELEQERNRLNVQLDGISRALSLLSGTRGRRTVSAAGRARIAAAQRARWAKSKGQEVGSAVAHKARTISPAARKRIVAAQKARWAKWRKAQHAE
jgi:hypothetical protein